MDWTSFWNSGCSILEGSLSVSEVLKVMVALPITLYDAMDYPFCFIICNTHTQPFNGPFSGTTLVNRYQKGKTNLDLTEARDSAWVAVASAGPCASLHLAPDRLPCQHPTTRFLQAGCPSCRPTNSVKALKAFVTVDVIYTANIWVYYVDYTRHLTSLMQIVFSLPQWGFCCPSSIPKCLIASACTV